MTFLSREKWVACAVLCWLAVTLAGCASGPIGKPPDAGAPGTASELVVIRPKSLVGGAVSFAVTLDGKAVFALRSGNFTRLRVMAGEHWLGVKCMSSVPGTYQEQSLPLHCEASATSYFLVSPAKGNLAYCAGIKQIDEAEGLDWISKSTYVPAAE